MRDRQKIKLETLKAPLRKNEILIVEILLDIRELLEELVKAKAIEAFNELSKKAIILAAIESLKRGWGADCILPDVNDVLPLPKSAKEYEKWLGSRCQSCRAKETIDFLKKHLSYL